MTPSNEPASPPITRFQGPYRWLSNFWPFKINLDDAAFPNVEHAYQGAKTTSLFEREKVRLASTPVIAKRFGRRYVTLREDWEDAKLRVMEDLLRQKFQPGSELAEKLLATRDAQLVEGNDWGDRFWGACQDHEGQWEGENHLGRLLMKIREELRGL